VSERNESTRRVRDLRELAQSIPPSRDLWGAIEAGIAREPAISRRRDAGWRHVAGLAATVAVLAVGVWIGRYSMSAVSGAPPVAGASGSMPGEIVAAKFSPGPGYTREREALLKDLEARIATLPPDTRMQVQRSLVTIRRSIDELKVALGEDPSNALVQELLVNAYQDEMRVLVAVKDASRVDQEI
jgi:hypothetical protein